MTFILHSAFKSKVQIINLEISKVALNETIIPWVILIPRIKDAVEIFDLPQKTQEQIWSEVSQVSKVVREEFKCDKINIAAFGNMVRQLHIHVIGRYEDKKIDKNYPQSIFDKEVEKQNEEEIKKRVERIRELLS